MHRGRSERSSGETDGREKDDRYHETVPGKQNEKNRMMISFY